MSTTMTTDATYLQSVLDSLDPETLQRCTRDRMGGSMAKAMREYLHTFAGGLCVVCELPTDLNAARSAGNYAEIGHLIAASTYGLSSARGGFVPGNLANMCHSCNAAAGAADYSFKASDVRADLVPVFWPVLAQSRKTTDSHVANAAARRAARGLPF